MSDRQVSLSADAMFSLDHKIQHFKRKNFISHLSSKSHANSGNSSKNSLYKNRSLLREYSNNTIVVTILDSDLPWKKKWKICKDFDLNFQILWEKESSDASPTSLHPLSVLGRLQRWNVTGFGKIPECSSIRALESRIHTVWAKTTGHWALGTSGQHQQLSKSCFTGRPRFRLVFHEC